MKCRFCNHELTYPFIDLVNSPPSNSFLRFEELNKPEIFFPLKLYVCDTCFLVQIDEYKRSEEIFSDTYAYFSSFSRSWLTHAKEYAGMIAARLRLTDQSFVVELASNDGYLLQYFKEKNIPCLGIEPAKSVADVARKKDIDVLTEFFGVRLAQQLEQEGKMADLMIGNNVLAHVPDINDFVQGVKILLKTNGVATFEFPHLMRLKEENQFDTIYHEHFSYFSFYSVERIFSKHGLVLFDVEELPTHGGSLRIYAGHSEDRSKRISPQTQLLRDKEVAAGINNLKYYHDFQNRANYVKHQMLSFLLSCHREGKKVAAYGAAAKGNTLLNYCGIKKDLIAFVVDASPHKQGKFLPGSHIPVVSENEIKKRRPDYILILPWNIKEEIIEQLEYVRKWNGKFFTAIPGLTIY
ncbi:methyltransferase domain-containing protein [Thermodesulfobacteriota bacterium]